MTATRTGLLAAVFLAAILPFPVQTAQSPAYDVILRGGTIVDGTGRPRYGADVAVVGSRIVRIGDLTGSTAVVDLDVTGLFVAPGFINIHSHASANSLPAAVNMLTQGVTTEIMNADGGGSTDLAAQLARLESNGLAVNAGVCIGFNSIWRTVVGPDDRRANDDEVERMRAMVVTGLEHGAWGVSAGLDYKPAYYATTDEVARVVEAARPWRTQFTNHERVTPESGFRSKDGVAETIAIGERAGLVPIVTHMKAQGPDRGVAAGLTALMRDATARGHFTASDVYPYLAGQTSLGALIIPAWAQDGGTAAMRERFADPALRARIVAEAEQAMDARFGSAQGVYLPASGRRLVDVMEELGVSHGEAVVRLLEESGNQPAILSFGVEEDLLELLRYPDAAIACDCGATESTRTHPRNYGTYPRVLGRYVRETQALTWEDAVRKMTGLPASLLGTIDRGFLALGMAADITVFDPATVIDHATYEEPAQYSEGIRHVLVNGRFALRDGAPTGERAGRTLIRASHMPSRPMRTSASRPAAITDAVAASRPGLGLVGDGLLQTAPGWQAWTGLARTRDGRLQGVRVIIDEAGPKGRSILVEVDGDGGSSR